MKKLDIMSKSVMNIQGFSRIELSYYWMGNMSTFLFLVFLDGNNF